MRAAFCGYERVDFVDDDSVDGTQAGRGFRGEEQIERFGRGDEDFGGMTFELGALLLRGVSGADAYFGLVEGDVLSSRHVRNAGERRAQVALNVDSQRL